MKQMTAEQFIKDVAKHETMVLMDNGCYRHLRFSQPKNSNQWFDLITWPGTLAIKGDMGTWVFSRASDMFTFFRSDVLNINASYWSEKIDSESRFGGPHKKFHPETFKENVLSSLDGYGLAESDKAKIIRELQLEVFSEDHEVPAFNALMEFTHECEDGEFQFSDPWEIRGDAYTFHFLWCLHAIVWGIQQYDAVHIAELVEILK